MNNWRHGFSGARGAFILLVLFGICQAGWAQGQQIIFSATGDVPYGDSEASKFQQQIANHNKYSPSAFFVHVGDIASSGECAETNYSQVASIMKGLAVPCYIVAGDNETIDCSKPAQGMSSFLQYFKNFEQNFCGAPSTAHQSLRPENWAFTMNGVLLIGINISYGGSSAYQQAADWVKQQFEAKVSQVRAAAVFAHYPPNVNSQFSTPFRQAAAVFGKPVLFLHGHGHSWSMTYPFPETNILRVQVNKGASEDPVEVTVTTNTASPATTFILKRKPWSSKQVVNMPPCVNAGPDQNISGTTIAILNGQAADDGDPTNTLITSWSKVSGPGTVSFGNSNARTTTASFSENGAYVLRLTASDGLLQKSDNVTINVNSSGGGSVPVISSFIPTSGAPGTVVAIAGSNFSSATSVTFNGVLAADFTIHSNSQIVTTVPTGATTGKIVISTATSAGISAADFTVNAGTDKYTFHPTDDAYVESLNAESNFGAAQELRTETNSAADLSTIYLKFNVIGVRGLLQSAKLRLKCIDGSTQGGSVFSVSNNYLNTTTPWVENGLTWSNAPAITSEALSSLGSVSSGKTVELNVAAAITGNGIYSFALKSTSSNLTAYNSKEGDTPPELVIQTVLAPPRIASFTPASGTMTTEVTLTGSAFTGTTAVAFNGTPAVFAVDSDSQLRATVPAGAPQGGGMISVINADGVGLSATEFIVLPPVTIASFKPASGQVATEVKIFGSKFTKATKITFYKGKPAVFVVESDTLIRATVPAGAIAGKIGVTNNLGTAYSATDFIVLAPPAIAAFTPASAPEGAEVTITGNFFTGTTGVAFNGNTAASIVVESDGKIRAKVPADAVAGTGKIVVTNALGSTASTADFTIAASNKYFFAPKHDAYVNSSSPTKNNGSANTLRGKTSASEVMQAYLKFEVTGLNGTLHSAKLRLYVSDASSQGGSLHLVSNNYKSSMTPWAESALNWNNAPGISPQGGALSTLGEVNIGQWVEFDVKAAVVGNGVYSFGLQNNNTDEAYYRSKEYGTATAPQLVILTLPSNVPSITSFTPSDGPVATEVTIIGNNFTGTKSVTFNGKLATSLIVDSNTQLRAKVPVGASSGKIKITNAIGTGSFAENFIVTATPTIASFAPSQGPENTEVTITGNRFAGTTRVTFNGQAAALFYLDSDTQIRAYVPVGATPGKGKIAVTNSAGNTASAADFTIIQPPLIFAPTQDAYVKSSAPTTNYGGSSTVRAKTGSTETFLAYLKFAVTGMSGALVNAKLRLFVTDESPDGGAVYLVSNDYLNTTTPWEEKGLLWGNAPSLAGTPVSSLGTVSIEKWVEFEVASQIIGDGVYSFALKSNNADAVYYSSKEGDHLPQLVVQMQPNSSPSSKQNSEEEAAVAAIPAEFILEQNYPNPFSSLMRGIDDHAGTQIRFGLPQASPVTIKIYSINGAEVTTLVDAEYPAGMHAITLRAKNLSSGTYFYVMQAGAVRKVRRLMLVK